MKKQRGRSRADGGLEVSEKSAVCLSPTRKKTKSVLRPYFRFAQIHSARGQKRMEKDESKSTGKSQPTEGTRLGHWCVLECKVIFNVLYRLKIENISL